MRWKSAASSDQMRARCLEVRNVGGPLHIARKVRNHDEIGPAGRSDHYGPDTGLDAV